LTTVAATLSTTELSASLLVFSLGGDTLETGYGANCVAFAGRDATVVVDPLVSSVHARLVHDALRSRGLPPVRWVIATHHHTDHVLGGSFFMERGAKFVAHREAASRMASDHPALVAERRLLPGLGYLFEETRRQPRMRCAHGGQVGDWSRRSLRQRSDAGRVTAVAPRPRA
jgi:glyoxylase-like metal-dependent hydrolase (beta-lactamase superfamily II)